jgi:hypothetical protein
MANESKPADSDKADRPSVQTRPTQTEQKSDKGQGIRKRV